jgi:hypothetical protein
MNLDVWLGRNSFGWIPVLFTLDLVDIIGRLLSRPQV